MIVTPELKRALAREGRYLELRGDKPFVHRGRRPSTVRVRVTSVGGLNEEAASLNYAAKLDVAYGAFEATADAEFDARGYMIEGAPPSGFRSVRIEVTVASDAPREQLERVHRLALEGCPGIATLRDPVAIESNVQFQEVAAAWRA